MKVLVVCETGKSASVLLQTKLEQVLPGNQYQHCSIQDINTKKFDIIFTFEDISQAVAKIAPADTAIRTIEELNDLAAVAFQRYLEDGTL